MHLQSIDVAYAANFKKHHAAGYDCLVRENNVPTTSADLRQLLVTLVENAAQEAANSFDLVQLFTSLGYICPSGDSVSLRSVPSYKFIPATAVSAPKPVIPIALPAPKPTIFELLKSAKNIAVVRDVQVVEDPLPQPTRKKHRAQTQPKLNFFKQ